MERLSRNLFHDPQIEGKPSKVAGLQGINCTTNAAFSRCIASWNPTDWTFDPPY